MNKSVKIIVVAIAAGILAFAMFQIVNYYYVDSLFNSTTGGRISDISQQDINDLKRLQERSQNLLDDFNSQ
jgi:hypothetical protein